LYNGTAAALATIHYDHEDCLLFLGLDLGTSGLKALLLDDTQSIVATADAALSVQRPQFGWSEQDPAAWIDATEQALDQLHRDYPSPLAAVRGIGLSGQMHGATLLDAADRVLRPCILWNDVRAHQEAAAFNDDPDFASISGNLVFPGFTAPKINWVEQHELQLRTALAKVLLPKDYLRLWLTGEHVSEMSDASGTAWLDIANRCWSTTLLAKSGLDERHMPSLVEGSTVSGQLRSTLAARWGMDAAVVVAGGAGDNAAAAVGMGTVQPGSAFASLGTSGVLFVSNAEFLPNVASAVHAFCHALPQRWHQMGVILSATDSLNWFGGVVEDDAGSLTKRLGETLRAPGTVNFLPYLSGERTPHNDAHTRGAFTGLTTSTDRDELTQAVLEGVAFAFRDNLEALRQAGTQLQRVTAVGGGSRSTYWLKCLATALELPGDVPHDGDFGAAFGAARLGMLAATGQDPDQLCTAPAIAHSIEPDASQIENFQQAWRRHQAIYPALRGATT
jgi:xylulokinase